jgi:hypothetical protein
MGCKNTFGHTNEQCAGDSDVVTINDEAKHYGDHGDASRQNEEILTSERNRLLLPGSVAFRSLTSLSNLSEL